ncbi:MAG: sigma 54-interacting transcriptional regulator [Puia sp.]
MDEVANLPYDVQVSLLRVVQERKMRRGRRR